MGEPIKPTIIVLENSFGFTGAFKAILQIAEDLSADYKFVFVIPKNSSVKADLEKKNIKSYEVSYYPINRSLKNQLLYLPYLIANAFSLLKISHKEKASIIHSNDLYNLAPLLTKILSFYKIKVVTHVRFLSFNFPPILFKFWVVLNKYFADKIICVSKAAFEPFLDNPKSMVIYGRMPIIESSPYHYQAVDNQNISLLYLANYTKGKGQIIAIDSFAKVLKVIPTAKLVFLGDDFGLQKNKSFKKDLENQAKDLGISENVIFDSFKINIEEEFKKHDIFLNFSYSESFSNTVMESLFYGIPCVATASGGPQEILEDGKYGVLIKERDADLIAKEIIQLSNDPELRKKMSAEGRTYIREKFSIEKTSLKMNDIYSDLL